MFEHGWAHAPSTRYSMPAILTGRLPLDVHYDTSIEGWPGLLPEATTIAEALDPVGFTTGAFTNYWYFDRVRHMDQGFAEYDNQNARSTRASPAPAPSRPAAARRGSRPTRRSAFVDRTPADRWFLWVHYYDPHYAYEPHPEVPSFGADRMALYDGEIRFTDLHIGRLLDELKAKGLYDKTVIVVTGDHGEGFGEHGVELHGYHLYAPQTKVPLIMRVPGLPPRRATTPAGHVDILPTLANLAGGPGHRRDDGPLAGRRARRQGRGPHRVPAAVVREQPRDARRGRQATATSSTTSAPTPAGRSIASIAIRSRPRTSPTSGACAETRTAVEKWYDAEQVPAGAAEALLSARPAIASPLDADLGASVRLLAVEAPPAAHRGEASR